MVKSNKKENRTCCNFFIVKYSDYTTSRCGNSLKFERLSIGNADQLWNEIGFVEYLLEGGEVHVFIYSIILTFVYQIPLV